MGEMWAAMHVVMWVVYLSCVTNVWCPASRG